MKIRKHLKKFWTLLTHPRVLIFILIGVSITFATFFTDNNALEIAISGMASIFIGIAVNNYSIVDTHGEDTRQLTHKLKRSLAMMEITVFNIKRINSDDNTELSLTIRNELTNLEKSMNLSIDLLREAGLIAD